MDPRTWRRRAVPPAIWLALAALGAALVCAADQPRLTIRAGANGPVIVTTDAEEKPDETDLADNVFLPAERTTLQRLTKAQQMFREGQFGEAVRHLGAILDGPEDYFFQPDKKAPVFRSLKSEAQRLIGQMPRRGRDLYQLQYGARAQQMLADAVATGDPAGLAEASRRYFHTQAGYEATYLAGLHHLDHGRPLAAALTLRRLRDESAAAEPFEPALSLALATAWLRAGMPDIAQQTLVALKRASERQPVASPPSMAGNPIAWFEKDEQAVVWLTQRAGSTPETDQAAGDQWLMVRGAPGRNAPSPGGAPLLSTCWHVRVTDDPTVEKSLRQLRELSQQQDTPALPGLHPLAVNDVVLMRTMQNLVAVDFGTGKLLWEIPVEEPDNTTSGSARDVAMSPALQWQMAAGQRVWDDATYGTLSSDGRMVFSVEDLVAGAGDPVLSRQVIVGGMMQMYPGERTPANRLAAHDIRTGKRKWEIGGPAGRFALPQAESFFLGPPLPLLGQLYVLAEVKGEIRLMALDAQTGNVQWSQQLAVIETSAMQDPGRRSAGLSPSYADGILLCPTSAGAVVAVDLATRSLLWGYRYPRQTEAVAFRTMRAYAAGEPTERWHDVGATVANGCVLVTPNESNWLYCLNLLDGKLLWKLPREDNLYLAGVYQGKVILVGRHHLRTFHLADGKPSQTVYLPEGSTPSGLGFLTGDQYYLPLSSGDVAAIDVVRGGVYHVSKSRDRVPAGNLVCYRGKVISQGLEGVDVFHQLDALRKDVDARLAAKPDDPQGLAMRGEILLDEGKRREAADAFRHAYQLDHDLRTRDLLRDAIFDGLRNDFAHQRDLAAEAQQLVDNPSQQATYLRLMATGLQGLGDCNGALENYMKLVELDQDHRRLENISPALSVRQDRWIQAQMVGLRCMANSQGAAELDRVIQQRLDATRQAGSVEALRRFLDYFGGHPSAMGARHDLIGRLKKSGRLLEAELLLWREIGSGDRARAGAAMAELAVLLREAQRTQDAASCYLRLRQQFSDVVCLDGKTGGQLADSLAADSPIRKLMESGDAWPSGKVELTRNAPRRTRTFMYGRFALEYDGDPGPFFSDLTLRYDQNQRQVLGQDGLGNQRWQVTLSENNEQNFYAFNRNGMRAHVCGHLAVLSLGTKVVALDTLSSGGAVPQVLWTQDLMESGAEAVNGLAAQVAMQGRVMMWNQPFRRMRSNLETNGLGPVTQSFVCYQQFRNIVAADPLTGQSYWVRRDQPPGCTLFGDDEYVFVVPPEKNEAVVLRAIDGELVCRRKLPKPLQTPAGESHGVGGPTGVFNEHCLDVSGRLLLLWHVDGEKRVLEAFDLWEQKPAWPVRTFAANAQASVVSHEAVGVIEPDGHFLLLGLPDGRTIADAKLDAEPKLSDLSLMRCGQQYVVVVQSPRKDNQDSPPIQPMPGVLHEQIGHGRVYAMDRQGKLLWPGPAVIDNQHLLLNQPGRLPVLVFASQVYQRQNKNGAGRYTTAVRCLDKRTGRLVYREDFDYSTAMFDVTADAEKKTVDLALQRTTVTLTFTDKPLPPGGDKPGDQPTAVEKPATPSRALWNALEKMFSAPAAEENNQ